MNITDLKHITWITIFSFILFASYFYLTGYKQPIPLYLEYMRVALTITYCCTIFLAMSHNLSKPFFFSYLFISFLFLSFSLQQIMLYATNTIYGETNDSYVYLSIGIKYQELGLGDFWTKILKFSYINLDDLGFTTVMHFCAKPFGQDVVSIATSLIVVNSVIYVIGAYYLYRLCILFWDDEQRARIATGLWAGFSTLITTSAGGAKEVIFTAIIVIAMYQIYAYKESPTLPRLLRALFFISLCILFRFAICYALVLSLLTIIFTNENNKRAVLKVAFFGILFSGFILSFILPALTGVTYEHILNVADSRFAKTKSSGFLVSTIFPSISMLIGPYPNMDRADSKGFMYGFSLLLKDFITPFFISAVYGIICNYSYRFYPVLVFIVCNLMMLLVSGVTLDIRYHITYMPFFFLLVMAPYNFIFRGYKYYVIMLATVVIIAFYSTRKLSISSWRPSFEIMR